MLVRSHPIPILIGTLLLALVVAPLPAARAQCPAPVGLAAENRMCSVRLTWQNAAGAPIALSWQIYRNVLPTTAGAMQVGTVATGTYTFDDTPPARGVIYFYFVRGVPLVNTCSGGAPYSTPAEGQLPPVAVSNLHVQTRTCEALTFQWSPIPEASSYTITRTSPDGTTNYLGSMNALTTTFTDTTGTTGVAYDYAVLPTVPCTSQSTASPITEVFPGPPVPGPAPQSISRRVGESATLAFSINVVGPSSLTYFIAEGDHYLHTDSHYTIGYTEQTITIPHVRAQDAGEYKMLVTATCGIVSQTAILAVRNSCPADFNESGGVEVQDIFDYLTAWFGGCP